MNDATGAIYVPPKSGLPFLVVTFDGSGIHTQMAASRSEARALLAKQTRPVRLTDKQPDGTATPARQ
jgi:hypothetical protein